MKKRSGSKGFSLVELLLAIALFTIFSVTIYQMFPLYKRLSMRDEGGSSATSLAQAYMEQWVKLKYDGIVNAYQSGSSLNNPPVVDCTDEPGCAIYHFKKSTTFQYMNTTNLPGTSNTKTTLIRVTVTVSYVQNGQTRSVSLMDYVSQLNPG